MPVAAVGVEHGPALGLRFEQCRPHRLLARHGALRDVLVDLALEVLVEVACDRTHLFCAAAKLLSQLISYAQEAGIVVVVGFILLFLLPASLLLALAAVVAMVVVLFLVRRRVLMLAHGRRFDGAAAAAYGIGRDDAAQNQRSAAAGHGNDV